MYLDIYIGQGEKISITTFVDRKYISWINQKSLVFLYCYGTFYIIQSFIFSPFIYLMNHELFVKNHLISSGDLYCKSSVDYAKTLIFPETRYLDIFRCPV